MRIKIATHYPLKKHFCWFPIEKKLEGQAVHQLADHVAKQLELQAEPADLKLLLDDCLLLPYTKIKNILRDGDTVIVKQAKAGDRKRKSTEDFEEESLSRSPKKANISTGLPEELQKEKKKKAEHKAKKLEEEKKKTEEKEKQKKKLEKEKTKKLAEEKRKAEEKKRKAEEKKKLEEQKKLEEEKKKKKKAEQEKKLQQLKQKKLEEEKKKKKAEKEKKQQQKKKLEEDDKKKKAEKKDAEEKERSSNKPFEGLSKTRKRNMRRRLLKEIYHNQTNSSDQVPEPPAPESTASNEPEEETESPVPESTPSNPPTEEAEPKTVSTGLLKKNKNKKKHHLTDPKADNHFHIHYEDADWDQPSEKKATNRNTHGRAFISYAESDHYYKGNPHDTEYPIHRMPTLFYAQDAEPTEPKTTAVDYDSLPDADFKSKIPAIGDSLAIKTLELTANYSPEISEWKQVVLKELNLPETITVEFCQGFYHNYTKGGKFDNKAHERREYDDYLYEEEEEQEEERIVTLNLDNIFAVKNMSTVKQ